MNFCSEFETCKCCHLCEFETCKFHIKKLINEKLPISKHLKFSRFTRMGHDYIRCRSFYCIDAVDALFDTEIKTIGKALYQRIVESQ